MKICIKCNVQKEYSLFYRAKPLRPTDDGYDYYCKQCRNATTKYYLENTKKKCTESGCDNNHYALSLCRKHYIKKRNQEKK